MEKEIKDNVSLMERLTECITFKLNRYLNKEGLELEKLRLGCEILLINVSKFLIIITIATIFNLLKETLLMILIFGILRKRTFGLHAKSSVMCTIVCILMFNFGAYFCQYLKFNNYIVFIIFLVINILLYKYAPADTECHPLLGYKLRTKLKREALLISIVLMLLALIIPNDTVKTVITLAESFAVIIILPITYKILKRRYRNYEKYEREII